MKRALAVCTVLCVLAFAGFSQITGKWTASLCLDATYTPTLTSELSITYNVGGFDITSVTGFGAAGLTSQKFTLKGAFGPFSLTGNMIFDVSAIAYKQSDLTTGLDFAGVGLTLKIEHWAAAYQPSGLCDPAATDGVLRYTLTASLAPITAKLVFLDCCSGTAFQQLLVTLKGLSLCCGITYDAEFSFLKSGFDYVTFSIKNFAEICCGISFDMSVKFTPNSKSVKVTPKFGGFGVVGCIEVYGDVESEGGEGEDLFLNAIRIDGFKIGCTLGDCNELNFVTFLSPDKAEDYGYTFDTDCGEFEFVEMKFCGPTCCGDKYTVALKIYFGSQGGLFDVTRLVYDVKLPLLANFTLNFNGTIPAADCADAEYCFGWTFSF